MENKIAGLFTEFLQEQAALIQKQLEKLKSFNLTERTEETTTKKKVKVAVDPNKPRRPLSGYQLFLKDNQTACKEANPNASTTELMTISSKDWNNLDVAKKQDYLAAAEKLKDEYKDKLKDYENTHVDGNDDASSSEIEVTASAAVKEPSVQTVKVTNSSNSDAQKAPAAKKVSDKAPVVAPSTQLPPSVNSEKDIQVPDTDKKKKKKKRDSLDPSDIPSASSSSSACAGGVTDTAEKKKKVNFLYNPSSCDNLFGKI